MMKDRDTKKKLHDLRVQKYWPETASSLRTINALTMAKMKAFMNTVMTNVDKGG